MSISERIRLMISLRGYTSPCAFCVENRIVPSTLSKILAPGEREPQVKTLIKLSKTLRYTTDQILGLAPIPGSKNGQVSKAD